MLGFQHFEKQLNIVVTLQLLYSTFESLIKLQVIRKSLIVNKILLGLQKNL